jgi:2-isopropylmalate synthase
MTERWAPASFRPRPPRGDGRRTWTTIGVSENIIEVSWQALSDSIVFGLLHAEGPEGAPVGRP